jgi:hypothetical protein
LTDYEANVVPDQAWSEDGTADVTPQPPCPINETENLPLEHRAKGQITILRANYPKGLVVLPNEGYPSNGSAILPMIVSSGDEIVVIMNQQWNEGGVAWFTD